jgi:4-alpha-glucanotransferase
MKHNTRSQQLKRDRTAGVLLHPTSLPGPYGVGDLGREAVRFLDWLGSAGQRIWQVLPLNPPGFGSSPYGCLSSFAGNPLLISPDRLLEEGLLPAGALDVRPQFPSDRVDFDRAIPWKQTLLRESHGHFQRAASEALRQELEAFERGADQVEWLEDWALFIALKNRFGQTEWTGWERDYALRRQAALESARRDLAADIAFQKFVQFLFFRQWRSIRNAAHERGIRIMGDVPIYTAADSADVWSRPEMFRLDADGRPTVVAGVPPDYFSKTGQRWGNPLYDWGRMKEDSYSWWISRVRANLRIVDVLRLDHFRGFAAYWEIEAHQPTAVHGRWEAGPGKPFFEALRKALGDLPLVAEDLGFISADVDELRIAAGLPGMHILQFAFDEENSPDLPHNYDARSVVYTGTHDNDTTRGWFANLPDHQRELACTYLGCAAGDIEWGLIRAAYTSVADTAIVPLQDILGVGNEGRMNRPGLGAGNWSWRFAQEQLDRAQAHALHALARASGRG